MKEDLALSNGSGWSFPSLTFFNSNALSKFFTISYWKFTLKTWLSKVVYSRHISLSPHSYSLVLFSISLILDDTFLQVLFRNAMLKGLEVISSVYLNPYLLTNPSTDILFTKMSCLMLWSLSLSSSVCNLLHTFSNMWYSKILSIMLSTYGS